MPGNDVDLAFLRPARVRLCVREAVDPDLHNVVQAALDELPDDRPVRHAVSRVATVMVGVEREQPVGFHPARAAGRDGVIATKERNGRAGFEMDVANRFGDALLGLLDVGIGLDIPGVERRKQLQRDRTVRRPDGEAFQRASDRCRRQVAARAR